MVSLEVIALVLTGLSITASIIYYANILNNANKARERDLVNQRITLIDDEFYAKWRRLLGTKWSTYKEYLAKGSDLGEEVGDIMSYFCTMLNSVGLLHKKNMIGSDLVFSVYQPNFVLWTWEKVTPVTIGNREAMNLPDLFSGFEYLYGLFKEKYPDINSYEEFRQVRAKIRDS